MKYLFVFKNNTWWLKIKDVDALFDYSDKTGGRWENAFNSLIHSKEFYKDGKEHASNLAFTIGTYGSRRGMNAIEAVADFRASILKSQIDLLLEGYTLFINENGGYHCNFEGDEPYSQFIWRNEFVFPNFSKSEIRIKKFPGGEHFYAFIGDMQVRDGDTLKWNTYEEAMAQAQKVVTRA